MLALIIPCLDLGELYATFNLKDAYFHVAIFIKYVSDFW